jgi:hypothetical protein
MVTRREMLHGMAALTASMGFGGLPSSAHAANKSTGKTKRVIFFLQNQGFDPLTCIPKGLKESCSLDSVKLAEPMQALEPYKEKMHIVAGLHGRHTSPSHSAYFGALGGYRGGIGVPPAAATIDHVLSQALPQTIMPHLCIGMDSIENMKARPTLATLSATGVAQPIFMHSDPNKLYQMIFGSIANGDVYKRYQARSKIFVDIEKLSREKGKGLPVLEGERYAGYVNGFREMNGLREKLSKVSGVLKKHAPKYDERYTRPKFETDWHDALLEIGIAALQANLTNVLTIGSGRGEIFGSWKGLGITKAGHNLGHMDQPDDEIWIKIRQYNTKMLIKLMNSLEAIPEGNGTMMDNTLIVYGSNNGAKQHTDGSNWPFVLIGNGGGSFKTGQFTQVKDRPLNDLYTTFLHGIGKPVDHFNISGNLATKYKSKVGPIEELMA